MFHRASEQPFSGWQCSPSHEGRGDKISLKKAHAETKTGYHAAAGGFTVKSGKNRQKKRRRFSAHGTCAPSWTGMPLRGPIGGRPSPRGNLVNTKLTLPPSVRSLSPRKVLLLNQKEDTYSSGGQRQKTKTIHGVGLAIKTSLCRQLPDLPAPVSERLMKLRFPLNPSRHVTVISAYASLLPAATRQRTLSMRNSTLS